MLYQPFYFLFWVLYFVVARGVFMVYHLPRTEKLSGSDILTIFLKGLQLDFSFTAYLSVIPFLAISVAMVLPKAKVGKLIRYYTYGMLALLSLLLSADLELYSFWGYRLDATPLQYLSTPTEMAASAAAAPLFLLTIVTIAISGGFILLYRFVFDYSRIALPAIPKFLLAGLAVLYLALLVLPLRGGVQQIPINQSVVYFSDNPYANHAGLNMPWNLMHALLKYNKESNNPYQYMATEAAEAKVQELLAAQTDTVRTVLAVQNPNVLFIILESYTAKFIGSLGGEQGVTPHLDALAQEGISFTNFYSSGDRSEKGMVALLSGYPVQTVTSIIKTPKKTEKLPQLSKVFEQQGYSTSFYYGGELEFANIKSYLLNGGYDKLIDKHAFPAESYNSKWGAHDHVLFERVLQDLNHEKKPFFSTIYTLSSHEPFEIPIEPKFPGSDNAAKFRNSVYYTDWALGRFIEKAKQQPWWANTLVVLVADHGHPLPGDDANYLPSKFRIPFILTGGALSVKGTEIATVGDQTSVAPTLLHQLGMPYEEFKWGQNLLSPKAKPFAFYVFNDGFGCVTPDGVVTFDNVGRKIILKDENVTDQQLEYGKAFMQYSFEDFIRK